MNKEFKITGYFQDGGYGIDVTIEIIECSSIEEAEEIARKTNLGELYLEDGKIYLKVDGHTEILNETHINRCEVLIPRPNIKHDKLMGFSIYEQEDYSSLSLESFIQAKIMEFVNGKRIRFESVAYGISEIT
ncbi:hypothetical protein IHV12_19930 [Fictibacillus sp. 7GRE50]|uniref:hypothetical protein n=1 Tax=Fictibacillus sp. 7GRE50 TaxID=2745878 RepID=UPI0018CE46E5|nr:hypothetical protein [Fictibacillus sp. 7GRE50]MBH0167197.1 hypothetical protein [Fictibacillus sp. 7GRE50]